MIDPEQVKRVALSAARSLVVAWLPGGVFHGDEYDVRNPCRADDDCPGNFRINVATGQWADFAVENVRGESVVSLCGYLRGLDSREAHEEVARQLVMIGDAASAPGNISAFVARVKRGDGAVAGEPLRCVFPVPDSAPPATNLGPMHWAYRDREGRLLGYVKRYKNGKDKAFSPITWWQDEHGKMGQWQMKHWPQPKPLYGLWRLPERPEAPVLLVEGEKTCEAAQRHFGAKFECLTWPGGASAWKVAHWLPLRGREVWLLPDDDEPGTKAMAGIATILKAICAEVHLASLAEPGAAPRAGGRRRGKRKWTHGP